MSLLLAVGFLLWFFCYSSLFLPINKVHISADYKHLTHTELQQAVLPFVEKKNFFSVNVRRLKQSMLQMSWIANVAIDRVWPNTISVYVEEQQPIARWQDAGGLNSKGELFMLAGKRLPDDLPRLLGSDGQHQLVLQQYTKLRKMMAQLGLQIKQFELCQHGVITMRLDNDMTIVVAEENAEQRVQQFVKLYAKVFGSRGAEAKYIDLRYPNGLAVRWRGGGYG